MNSAPPVPQGVIADFCKRNHIKRLALWGKGLPHYGAPEYENHIRVLVEFAPEHIPGLAFFRMQDELGEMFGHPVDLRTRKEISPAICQQALATAENLYVDSK